MWRANNRRDMAADRQDVERTVVKTYVPEYQKREWESHAEDLGMTQSEFLRVMVQAGRKGFLADGKEQRRSSGAEDEDPGGDVFEDRILEVLRSEGCCSWDELVERLTDDVEGRVEDALQGLQRENRVGYSGREGGYTLLEDP